MATKTQVTTSKKPRGKKVDFDSLAQTHGGLEPVAQRTVEEMLGYGSGYTVGTIEEYLVQIRAMSDADLQDHAVRVGVTPPAHRPRLEDRLENHFLTKVSRKTFQPQPVQMSEEALARQQRLMRGGW